MTFEIEIDGRRTAIIVEPLGVVTRGGGQFRVALRDLDSADPVRVRIVDSRPTDLGLSLAFEDGRIADAAVTTRPNDEYLIQLPGIDVPVTVDGQRRRRAETAATGKGEQRIVAPMPGRLLRVLVKPGDDVVARQGLVVIEAMKMENELRATRPGRVREVTVAAGTSVEAGRLLVIVD
jgi:biotin carboxyl carrier protein